MIQIQFNNIYKEWMIDSQTDQQHHVDSAKNLLYQENLFLLISYSVVQYVRKVSFIHVHIKVYK